MTLLVHTLQYQSNKTIMILKILTDMYVPFTDPIISACINTIHCDKGFDKPNWLKNG